MFNVLESLKSLVIRVKTFHVDNGAFRLHYRYTVIVLLAFSLLVTCRQFFGDPIDCSAPSSTHRGDMIDQFCWATSTFTLPKAHDQPGGHRHGLPGIASYYPGDEVIYHQYYQWVCFVLFLQAAMFYFPHFVWKSVEAGRLKTLILDLDSFVVSEDTKNARLEALKLYFASCLRRHTFYAYFYCFCEVLNFVNVIGQMFLTNKFLGGAFWSYGSDVLSWSNDDQFNRTDPMIKIFPRVTKCLFRDFGSGADMQGFSYICVLPNNIINEKIYIFLWFWFILVAIISGLALVYRVLTIFVPRVRFMVLRARANYVKAPIIANIVRRLSFPDWLLLQLLCKNCNGLVFRDITTVLTKHMENEKSADTTADDVELLKMKKDGWPAV